MVKMSLEEMQKKYSKDTIDTLFTEYIMTIVAKASLLDKVADALEKGKTIEEIREIVNGGE